MYQNINLNLLKYFYEVVNVKNITKASQILLVSQPALTKSIKELEEELNVKLLDRSKKGVNPTLIPTGIKAYMADDEVLYLYNRSSNPKKKGLILANSVGVIDKDYYNNPDNDGHIMFAFYNMKEEDIIIKKGEAIGQGVFMKYLVTDDDKATGIRTGGFGSTDKKKKE